MGGGAVVATTAKNARADRPRGPLALPERGEGTKADRRRERSQPTAPRVREIEAAGAEVLLARAT